MRPLKLTMSAFGPYAGEQVLNLGDLGTSGIYLITGNTGAGKTTIFDGISYALYGEPSGDSRSPKMLRSEYADNSTETFVELEFENKGKVYKIYRSPEYMRLSKKGNNYTKSVSSIVLTMPNGRIITQKKEVTQELKNILGVDRNQFSQIAMVAQGEFRKLLTADTKEREKIFRDIFGTSFYQRLQNQLDTDSKDIDKKIENEKNSIKDTINFISCKEDDVLNIDVNKAKEDKLTTEKLLEVIDKLIQQDKENKKELECKQKKVTDSLNDFNVQLGLAIKQRENQEKLEKVSSQLEQSSKEIVVLEEKLMLAKSQQPEIDSLSGKIAKLEDKLPKFTELEKNKTNLATSKINLSHANDEIVLLKKKIQHIDEELQDKKSQLENLKDVDAEIVKIENELKEVQNRINEIHLLNNDLKEFYSDCKELDKLNEEFKGAYKTRTELVEKFELSYQAFIAGQAGILAEELKDNEACPVCGSTSHPKKAIKTENAPTKEQLECIKADKEKATTKVDTLTNSLSELKGKIQTQKESIEKKGQSLLGVSNVDKLSPIIAEKVNELKTREVELSTNKENAKSKVNQKNSLEKEIPILVSQKEMKSSQCNQCETNIATLNEKINNLNQIIDEISKELGYDSENKAKEQLAYWNSENARLKEDIDYAESKYNQVKSDIETLKGSIISYKESLKDTELFDIDALNSSICKLSNESKKLNSLISDANTRLHNNEKALNQIKIKSDKLIELEKQYSIIESLNRTAKGGLSGKEKITLETYVQTAYFERIIFRANQRLRVMSNGQYELVRREESDNKKAKSGLDLDVKDYYSGSIRDTKSLSGGESFLASLSLALGLSDEVQISSGGVRLDTMFIDEGFGSLDGETLQLAFKALASLSNDNKLVGIISHVDELKSKIDRQIVISKDRSKGSTAKIVL